MGEVGCGWVWLGEVGLEGWIKVGDCEIYFECTMHNCDARPERLLCDLIFSNLSYVFNLSTRSNLTSVLRCYTYILDVLVFTIRPLHGENAI